MYISRSVNPSEYAPVNQPRAHQCVLGFHKPIRVYEGGLDTNEIYYHSCVCVFLSAVECSQGCVNGECTDRDQCSCDDGWTGASCNEQATGQLGL